jgi:hypothetical protein
MEMIEACLQCLMRVAIAAIVGATMAIAALIFTAGWRIVYRQLNPLPHGAVALNALQSSPLLPLKRHGVKQPDSGASGSTALWVEIGGELRSGSVNATRGTTLTITWAAHPDRTIVLDSVDPFSGQTTRSEYVSDDGNEQVTISQSELFLIREKINRQLRTRGMLEVNAEQ